MLSFRKKLSMLGFVAMVTLTGNAQKFKVFEENGLKGYKDAQGKTVVAAQYTFAGPEFDGLAYVQSAEYSGFLNMDNKTVQVYCPGLGGTSAQIKGYMKYLPVTILESGKTLKFDYGHLTEEYHFGPTSGKCFKIVKRYINAADFKAKIASMTSEGYTDEGGNEYRLEFEIAEANPEKMEINFFLMELEYSE